MNALKIMFVGLIFLFSMQFSYAIHTEEYEWVDGTTAPLECVDICKSKGVYAQSMGNGNPKRLSNECKEICFGKNAILDTQRISTTERNEVQAQEGKNDDNEKQNEAQVQQGNNEGVENNSEIQAQQRNENTMAQNETKRNGEVANIVAHKREIIRKYVDARKELHLGEIEGDSDVNITPTSIRIQGEDIAAIAKTISVNVRSREVNIIQNENSLEIEDEDNTSASVDEVEIKDGEILVGGLGLGLLPSEIKERVKGEIKQLRIEEKNGELIYEATANRRAKLLWIFDVEYEVISNFEAQNGESRGSNKPLWSILAFE